MLIEAINTTPCITSEVVDLYHSKLEFIMDRHRLYVRPRGFKKQKQWAIGAYRMNAQDIEDIIKEDFDEDMR